MTVGEYFGDSLSKFDRRAFDHLSNGNLQFVHLRHSPEAGQILKCCRNVVARLSSMPFAGRITLAKIMADAMEELQETKGMSAPRAWYPVIKQLRAEHKRGSKLSLLCALRWRPETFSADELT
jgi:hypothetical protein